MNYKFDFPPNLHVGTSSWSSKDWYEVFYPPKIKPEEFIAYYAQHFDTVEIDSTWHYMPAYNMVNAWNERTPDHFTFAAKVPKVITHEKYLVDCQPEMEQFLRVMERLGPKLGPLVFQFQYFAKGKDAEEYKTGADFMARLDAFLKSLPTDFRYVVEIRNSNWMGPALLDLLRKYRAALCLIDYYTMTPLDQLMEEMDVVTSDFIYVRFLGNHKQIDALVEKMKKEGKKEKGREWNELIVDRRKEMERRVPAIAKLLERQIQAYVYFNNHYAGFAPGSIQLFAEIWQEKTKSEERRATGDGRRATGDK
jgi:uncharacterized protein YecE (DUF72 family)